MGYPYFWKHPHPYPVDYNIIHLYLIHPTKNRPTQNRAQSLLVSVLVQKPSLIGRQKKWRRQEPDLKMDIGMKTGESNEDIALKNRMSRCISCK